MFKLSGTAVLCAVFGFLLVNGSPVPRIEKLKNDETKVVEIKKDDQKVTELLGTENSTEASQGSHKDSFSTANPIAAAYIRLIQAANLQLDQLSQNATDEQRIVIAEFLAKTIAGLLVNPKKSEETTVRLYANLHKEHPDVYKIMVVGFDGVQSEFNGSDEAREFLKGYFGRINPMKSGSDEEFALFLKDVRALWSKVSKKAQQEVRKEFGPTIDMIEA
ncbi:hypothetical protein M3Y97_01126000 [Aphelenchoides bicaudatus]|nr:hypothetical protein M3Y97_01126000 [Aphelenchoides bicaudatus]